MSPRTRYSTSRRQGSEIRINRPLTVPRGRARVAHEPANFHYLIDPTARSGLGLVVRFTTDPQATHASTHTAVIARSTHSTPTTWPATSACTVATMNPAFNCPQRCADLREEAGCDQITRKSASATQTLAAIRTAQLGWMLVSLVSLAVLAGCGSSSEGAVSVPRIAPARTYSLAGFGALRTSQPRTRHAAVVHDSAALGQAAHRIQEMLRAARRRRPDPPPPPTATSSTTTATSPPMARSPSPSCSPHPGATGSWSAPPQPCTRLQSQNNFQLFTTVQDAGSYRPQPIPPFNPTQPVDGYRFQIQGTPHLHAIQANFLTLKVLDPHGRNSDLHHLARRTRTRDLLP